MTIINFYKLFSLEGFLPSIALISNKILDQDEKAVLFFESEEKLNEMDERLWSFSQSEFIPHLSELSDEFEEDIKDEVPLLLSNNKNNIINATNLFIFAPCTDFDFLQKFNKVFFLFNPEIEAELLSARTFWKEVSALKEKFDAKFYEQSAEKKWSLKL